MKVLILVPQFPMDTNKIRGGVHSALYNLLKGFQEFPVTIRVLSFNNNISAPIEKKINDFISVFFEPEGFFTYHLFNYLIFGPSLLNKHCKSFSPDIIHFQEGNSFLLLNRGLKKRIPVLLTIHGNSINDSKYKIKLSEKFKWLLNGYLERILLPRKIIFLSSISANNNKLNRLLEYQIIPNAIDEAFFSLPLKKCNENKLLFIGVLNNRRNLLLLLKTLNILIQEGRVYSLDVLGGFEDMYYKNIIDDFINKSQLNNVVRFHGWVGQNVVQEFLKKSDILVMTSMVETLPMVIAEAMAAGKVVVSSDVGGVRNMIEDKKNGFIFSLNQPHQLYDILLSIYDNDYLIKKISLSAQEMAYEKYHHHLVSHKTLLFYKRCMIK